MSCQAQEFLAAAKVPLLAVCVGNRHGPYSTKQLQSPDTILNMSLLKVQWSPVRSGSFFFLLSNDQALFGTLQELSNVAATAGSHIVLHGASGLPDDIVKVMQTLNKPLVRCIHVVILTCMYCDGICAGLHSTWCPEVQRQHRSEESLPECIARWRACEGYRRLDASIRGCNGVSYC